jgi:antitoxin (DNA-binding transcriptional repressor) of toxin-antitoxin stability system
VATRITATELSRNLSDILSRVQHRGESFVIERNGKSIGELRPAVEGPTWAEFMARMEGVLTRDESFADDLETAHRMQGEPQVRDWPD